MPQKKQDIGTMFGSGDTGTFLGLPSCPDLELRQWRHSDPGSGMRDALCERRCLLRRRARRHPFRHGALFGDAVPS